MTYDPKDMLIGDTVLINGQAMTIDSVPSIDGGPFAAHYLNGEGGEVRGVYWAGQLDTSVDPLHDAATIELLEHGTGEPEPVKLLPGEPAPVVEQAQADEAAAKAGEQEITNPALNARAAAGDPVSDEPIHSIQGGEPVVLSEADADDTSGEAPASSPANDVTTALAFAEPHPDFDDAPAAEADTEDEPEPSLTEDVADDDEPRPVELAK